MRSLRIATWTSGDPVSPSLVAYSVMSACLRSAVIDTDLILSTINDSYRPEAAVFNLRERNQYPLEPNARDRALGEPVKTCPYLAILRRHALTATDSRGFCCRQGQRRNAV